MPSACVVVPTKNEAKTIATTIAEIRAGLAQAGCTENAILVVDDSRDATRSIALEHGAGVVRGGGDGLGAAVNKGLKAAVELQPDVILIIDGDGQADAAAEIPRFIAPIIENRADLVLGSRFLAPDLVQYEYPFINRTGTRVLSAMLRAQTGLPLTDSHGGVRAMHPAVAADLELLGTFTYVQESIIDAAEKGYRVIELPSAWRKREHGKSRVVGSITKYVFYTLPILILRSGNHIRWLYMSGIICILIALATFGFLVFEEGLSGRLFRRITGFIFIALMCLSGMQLFFSGFILQLLKQIKKNQDRQGQLPNVTFAKPLKRPGA
jgi:glycosyltransferase involved in cell wall biosynthesis